MHHRLSKQRARGGGGKRDERGSVITALRHSSFSYPVVFPARAESRRGANVLGLQERGRGQAVAFMLEFVYFSVLP